MSKITIKQASEILRRAKTTILRHIKCGRLPANLESIGSIKVYLIDEEDLDLISNLKTGPQKSTKQK